MEELYYPIKYAVMPVYLTQNDENSIGSIVTKCFVVKELTCFKRDGTIKKEYNVVFPFKDLNTFKSNKKMKIPKLKYDNSDIVLNAEHVDVLFDTYEEAKEKCNSTNYAKDPYYYKILQDFEDKVTEATEVMKVQVKNKQKRLKHK